MSDRLITRMALTHALTTATSAIALAIMSSALLGSEHESAKTLIWPAGLPVYDHVVIVVEENKDVSQIIGNENAPYINQLAEEGAFLTRMFAQEHFSQGNYFWLFSGSNQNVGFSDQIPTSARSPIVSSECGTPRPNPNFPFTSTNLGQQLIAKGLTFKGYAESLPSIGSTVACVREGKTMVYARKHVPWISFANVPNGTTVATSSNLRFKDFPGRSQFHTLPTVAFVIPNLENDMHNGRPEESIPKGDTWLREKLNDYYQWAKEHNSLLIVTFDENDDKRVYQGLTNPFVHEGTELRKDLENRVVTIFAGAHVKPGEYQEGIGVTHVNILRTLEAMYGLPKSGAQQPNAAGFGISDDYLITDVFEAKRP